MPSDVEIALLVRRVQAGEPEAFTEVARRYLRPAYAVSLAMVGRPSDAQDVAQEALIKAFERIHTCREPARFGGWLFQIVRNESRNWIRSRGLREAGWGRGEGSSDDMPSQGDAPETLALRRELLGALEGLSERQREVVLLHDLQGWTHPEIAAALGISETMSRQHIFQARRRLRALLGEDREVEAGGVPERASPLSSPLAGTGDGT